MKRNIATILVSIGVLTALLAVGLGAVFTNAAVTHAAGWSDMLNWWNGKPAVHSTAAKKPAQNPVQMPKTTLNGLNHNMVVGSTALIVDNKGRTITADANPYGVAIVPKTNNTMGNAKMGLHAGDIVVTNIGGEDKGKTLVTFPNKMGPGHLFNTMPNAGTNGPADMAFNTQTGSLWVANFSGNNVQVFMPNNGTVSWMITNPMFNKPWGMAYNQGIANPVDKSTGSFFVSNAGNATIDRIDIVPANGKLTFKVFQIGQLQKAGDETKIALWWMPVLRVKNMLYKDVLLALDPAANRIAAFPNSTTRNTTMNKSMEKGVTVFQGKPLNMPGGFTLNPINGDLLVVNLMDNNMIELSMNTGKVVAWKTVDNVPVDPKNGNGSALFGITATTDKQGNLVVYYTDDNTNTLNMLSI